MTSPATLALEAVVVGVVLVVVFFAVHAGAMAVFKERAMSDHALLAAQVALAGALFHVGFEVAGLNAWYCADRARRSD